MSLAEKNWRRAAIHDVVLAWLRAERAKVAALCANLKLPPLLWSGSLSRLLDQFDLEIPKRTTPDYGCYIWCGICLSERYLQTPSGMRWIV